MGIRLLRSKDPPVPARLIALSDHYVDPLLFNQQRLLERGCRRQDDNPLLSQTLDRLTFRKTKMKTHHRWRQVEKQLQHRRMTDKCLVDLA